MSRRKHFAAALLGFLVVLLASPLAFATEEAANAANNIWGIALGAGLGIGLAAFGGALAQGKAKDRADT